MSFTLRELVGNQAPIVIDECPTGKRAFPTKDVALRAVAQQVDRQPFRSRPLQVYRCGYCDRYHLGHRR